MLNQFRIMLLSIAVGMATQAAAQAIAPELEQPDPPAAVTPKVLAPVTAPPTPAPTSRPAPTAPAIPAVSKAVHVSDDTWEGWPGKYSQYIGYESANSSTSVIGQNIIVYGWWKRDWATEFFLGFTKPADAYSGGTTTNSSSGGSSTTVSNSGVKNPYVLTLGLGQNHRMARTKWLQVYSGYFGGLTYTSSVSYSVGSTTTSVAANATAGNYSITNSGYGNLSQSTDLLAFVGGKIGADFYLKWFPNLALGFASGLLTTFGGATTINTTSQSGTDTYTNGTRTTPSPMQIASSSTKSNPGSTASTFGVGGTVFQLTGAFTLRYVW